jgi:hypothetical protein
MGKMRTLRKGLTVILVPAILAALFTVVVFAQAKEQAYEAAFGCAISVGSPNCSATADKEIPAGMRLRVERVKARIVMPSRTKSEFTISVEVGDPAAPGGIRSIRLNPTLVGPTEGRFYNIWAVEEKVEGLAQRTEKSPAPKIVLSNPGGDPLYLQAGSIQEGSLSGRLVGAE